jgi:cytochrome c-type biogenesis protein CcmH/NrfG
LIWLIGVAVVFVVGGAWFVSRSMLVRGIVAAVGVVAVAAYWFLGKPDMRDAPLAGRLAEIESQARENPESMTPMQLMALLGQRAQENPDDPTPHMYMGKLLQDADRPTEALLAYESALRRDPANLETLRELPDLRFQMTGEVDPATTALYHQWYRLEPEQLRAGYMAGLGDWLTGKKTEAEALWAEIEAKTPEGDPRRQMFTALRQAYGVDPAPPDQAQPPG